MQERGSDEIELTELILFLSGKYKSIMLSIAFSVAVGFIFILMTANTLQMKLNISLHTDTPSTYALCGQDEQDKRSCMRAVIISTFRGFLPDELKNSVVADKAGFSATVLVSGSREEINQATQQLQDAVSQMQHWYIADSNLKNYTLTEGLTGTETYARLSLLSDAVKQHKNFSILNTEITPKYKGIFVIFLSGFIGGFLSVTWHLFSRSYKRVLNRTNATPVDDTVL